MDNVKIGQRTQLGEDVKFVKAGTGKVVIGDYCRIGAGVKFIVGDADITIGDWTTLHDNTLVLGGQGVTVGQHCWFGQNCILDGTGALTVGRGVRVGMYSQLWSHVAAGEQLEGCTLIGERPVVIEDEVWLVGSCIVASGVTLGKRLVALIGSNITKSFAGEVVLAGSPAKVKEGLSFYKEVTLDEKFSLLSGWSQAIANDRGLGMEADAENGVLTLKASDGTATISFVSRATTARAMRADVPAATICCIEDKTYNKTLSKLEESVLRDLSGNKARFYAA